MILLVMFSYFYVFWGFVDGCGVWVVFGGVLFVLIGVGFGWWVVDC